MDREVTGRAEFPLFLAADFESLAVRLRCSEPRCATILATDAEICDECGGSELERMTDCEALLVGETVGRPVAFCLRSGPALVIGRSAGSATPDVDLSRFSGSNMVHRLHARIERVAAGWTLTHVGHNPVVIQRGETALPMETGESRLLFPGDQILVGAVGLRFLERPYAGGSGQAGTFDQ